MMTEKQLRFIEVYLGEAKRNGSQAARLAGYSPDRAAQEAYDQLHDPEVKAEISRRWEVLTMTSEEAAKQLSDIAATRLNDYFIVKEVQGYEQVEEYVTVLLQRTRDEIELIQNFITTKGLNKKQAKGYLKQIEALQKKEVEYQLEVMRFGNDVTRLVAGRPVVMERVELDLVAIARDKEGGRIKSYKPTEFGPVIEMYSADTNLKQILEYHGKIVKKHELSGEVNIPQIVGMVVK